MGAVCFSLDRRLVECLQREIALPVLVETGTFQGDTVAQCAALFDEIHTVELSPELYQQASDRFLGQSHIHVHQDNSPDFLIRLRDRLVGRGVLYWLDAHWCVAQDTAGQTSQCPLLEELAALEHLDERSVILIDDARLYLCPPPDPHEVSQWPGWQQILSALARVSDRHETMIVNDVVAFYPIAAREAMNGYSRKYSLDWLMVMHQNRHVKELQQRCDQQKESIGRLRQRVQEQAQTIDVLKKQLDQPPGRR